MKNKKGKKTSGKSGFWQKLWHFVWKTVLIFFIISILLTVFYRWINPPVTPLMLIRKIKIDAPIEKKWTKIEDINPKVYQCAVAAEDNNFLGHKGFDFGAIQKAIDERQERGRVRGASTISQQTAKNVFLWDKQSWVRKAAEVYFTFLIELFWSKERIMEVYLNVIEMGNGIYGIEAASQHYFHKSAKKISNQQAALIVASLPSPLKRNPAKPSNYLNNRASAILSLSNKIGTIKFDKKSIDKARERYQKREDKRIEKNEGKFIDL
jgi:monofunctional biosynthetic peptidoglycan transglycosylase